MRKSPAQNSGKTAPGRPFQPGRSGNPGGRPKGVKEFEALARQRSPEALERLRSIAGGRGMPAVRALEVWLAYAWGRPMQNITANSRGGPLPPAFAGAARAQLERALADAAPRSALEAALAPADDETDDETRDDDATEPGGD